MEAVVGVVKVVVVWWCGVVLRAETAELGGF